MSTLRRGKFSGEEEIPDFVDRHYHWSKLERTRNYLIEKTREDHEFRASAGFMLKEDLIDQYIKKRHEIGKPVRNYDWSLVPDHLDSVQQKFKLICNDTNLKGEIIGEYTTCYDYLVDTNQEHMDYAKKDRSKAIIEEKAGTFIQRLEAVHGTKYRVLTPYVGRRKKITLLCPEHGEFVTTPAKLLYISELTGNPCGGCPVCSRQFVGDCGRLSQEEFLRRMKEVCGDKYDFSNTVYRGYWEKIDNIICNKCGGLCSQSMGALLDGFEACPECYGSSISRGEQAVIEWFNNTDLSGEFKRQHRVKNSDLLYPNKNSEAVIIDGRYIQGDKEYWIEYNGQQHVKRVAQHLFAEGYERQIIRDESVRLHCKDSGIILIEIPHTYNTRDKIFEVLNKIIVQGLSPEEVIKYPEIEDFNIVEDFFNERNIKI